MESCLGAGRSGGRRAGGGREREVRGRGLVSRFPSLLFVLVSLRVLLEMNSRAHLPLVGRFRIITGSPSSTYFPSSLFPQIEPTSSLPPQPDSDSPPSSPQIYPDQPQLQVRHDHLSHSVSTIDLSASVDWSESGSGWDDGCTGDVEVDEGVEDLLMDRGEEWTEVRWLGEGR